MRQDRHSPFIPKNHSDQKIDRSLADLDVILKNPGDLSAGGAVQMYKTRFIRNINSKFVQPPQDFIVLADDDFRSMFLEPGHKAIPRPILIPHDILRGRQDKLPIPTAARAHPLRCSLGQRPLWASSLVRASRLHPWRSSLYVSYPTIPSVEGDLVGLLVTALIRQKTSDPMMIHPLVEAGSQCKPQPSITFFAKRAQGHEMGAKLVVDRPVKRRAGDGISNGHG